MYVLQGSIPTLEDNVGFGQHTVTGFTAGTGDTFTADYVIPLPAGTEVADNATFVITQANALVTPPSGAPVDYSYTSGTLATDAAQWTASYDSTTKIITYTIGGFLGIGAPTIFPGFQIDLVHPFGATRIYPADMCTWHINSGAEGGYELDFAEFWNGGTVSSQTGTGASAVVTQVPVSEDIHNPQLGYIGKSGRFVQIAK